MNPNLSPREMAILRALGWGQNYTQIAVKYGISRANVNSTCAMIRRKTGIMDTRDVDRIRLWIKNNRTNLLQMEIGPTKAQLRVLRLLADGMSTREVASVLQVSYQCVVNHACSGRHRAKITDLLPSSIRAYFAGLEAAQKADLAPDPVNPMDDPMF